MRSAIFCLVRAGIWSEDELKPHFQKGMGFFVSMAWRLSERLQPEMNRRLNG
jgi:hypothetical protein